MKQLSKKDRRKASRVPLGLEFAVPVEVHLDAQSVQGLARNISEGGMLVQLSRLLPIGKQVTVTFSGRSGALTLRGEVRHQVAWQHSGGPNRETLYGIGVRFLAPEPELPTNDWVWQTDIGTIH